MGEADIRSSGESRKDLSHPAKGLFVLKAQNKRELYGDPDL